MRSWRGKGLIGVVALGALVVLLAGRDRATAVLLRAGGFGQVPVAGCGGAPPTDEAIGQESAAATLLPPIPEKSCVDDGDLASGEDCKLRWNYTGCGGPGRIPCYAAPYCHFGTYIGSSGLCQFPEARCIEKAPVPSSGPLDVTFLVGSDLHVGTKGTPLVNAQKSARLMNSTVGSFPGVAKDPALDPRWPASVRGGGAFIADPVALITTGDITQGGYKTDLGVFRFFYENALHSPERPHETLMPSYPGLGNHDLNEASSDLTAMWEYVDRRVKGCDAITEFHEKSKSYSWDWNRLHLVQLHTWADDTEGKRATGGLQWLRGDLKLHAGDGRPVILFQHYSFDTGISLAQEDGSHRWWSPDEAAAFAEVIRPYNVVAIFTGHTHQPRMRSWKGLDYFEGSTGGKRTYRGGFFAVHVTDDILSVAHLEWDDLRGESLFVTPGLQFSKGSLKGPGGLCLGWSGATEPDAPVSFATCVGRESQRWRLDDKQRFVASRDGSNAALCLHSDGAVAAKLATCDDDRLEQRFTITTAGEVVAGAPTLAKKCMWTRAYATLSAPVDWVACSGKEKWTFPGGTGAAGLTGQIRSAEGGCLDVVGDRVALRSCDDGATQRWSAEGSAFYVSQTDTYTSSALIKDQQGRCLDVAGGAPPALGAALVVTGCGDADSVVPGATQQWRLTARGELRGLGNQCVKLVKGTAGESTLVTAPCVTPLPVPSSLRWEWARR